MPNSSLIPELVGNKWFFSSFAHWGCRRFSVGVPSMTLGRILEQWEWYHPSIPPSPHHQFCRSHPLPHLISHFLIWLDCWIVPQAGPIVFSRCLMGDLEVMWLGGPWGELAFCALTDVLTVDCYHLFRLGMSQHRQMGLHAGMFGGELFQRVGKGYGKGQWVGLVSSLLFMLLPHKIVLFFQLYWQSQALLHICLSPHTFLRDHRWVHTGTMN